MTNVYAAPTADFADMAGPGETRMFSLSGRIGRVRWLGYCFGAYWLSSIVIFGLLASVGTADTKFVTWLPIAGGLLNLAAFLLFARRRLQDLGLSPFFILVAFIPVVNLIFFLVMVFKRGDDGENQYGPPPRPNDRAAILLAWSLPAIAIIGFLAAIAIPAFQG